MSVAAVVLIVLIKVLVVADSPKIGQLCSATFVE
jgi:hypothetical protein